MKNIFRSNIYFFIPYFLFLIAGAILITVNSKQGTHLAFNNFHSPFFDTFFYLITWMGDGWNALLVFVFLLAVKFRYALLSGLSCFFAGLITQVLKHSVFADVVRPKKFFEGLHDLRFVPGVENFLYNSFPSGHSTCIFALCMSVSFMVKKNYLKFICFMIALLTAYSRVYLSQHFFEDIYAGSLVGTITSIIVFYFLSRYNAAWLDKSVVSLFI